MGGAAQNHYQVLRIERTADERTIKKAYFSLVREFPPDKHPEEFRRIREAYEVLSDPTARERFDNIEKDYLEYGPEVAAQLREIDRLTKEGDPADLLPLWERLVADHPDLVIAREGLGQAHVRAGAFDKALVQWRALCKQVPTEARFHLFRGVAYHRLEQPAKAEAAIRKANTLEPDALRFQIALIDLLSNQKRHGDAVSVIDEALARPGLEFNGVLALELRKVDALCGAGDTKAAHATLGQLFERVRTEKDAELPKFVASQVASTAARMFAQRRFDDANGMLARCAEICPEDEVHHPFPARVVLDVAALPRASQEWLAALKPGSQSATLREAIWAWPVLALFGALGLSTLTVALLRMDPSAWTGGGAIAAAIPIVGSALALAFSIRLVLEILRSPLRAFATIHPLYFLRARASRLEVYPLFNLADVRAAHHHTNGVYTHTQITLRFATHSTAVRIRGQEYAQGWLRHLIDCRDRSLELMGEGFLEAERGVELIPPALLCDLDAQPLSRIGKQGDGSHASSDRRREAAERRRRKLRWYGLATAAGVALTAAAAPYNAWRADEASFRTALSLDTDAGLRNYLHDRPSGRYAAQARAQLDQRFDAAIRGLRAVADIGATEPSVLADALATLRGAGVTTIPMQIETDLEWTPPAATDKGAEAAPAFDASALKGRGARIATLLNGVADAAGIAELVRFAVDAQTTDQAPVALFVRGKIRPEAAFLGEPPAPLLAPGLATSAVARSKPAAPPSGLLGRSLRVRAMEVAWDVRMVIRGATPREHVFSTRVLSPPRLPIPAGSAATAYDRLADLAFDDLAERLVADLGLHALGTTVRYTGRGNPVPRAAGGR